MSDAAWDDDPPLTPEEQAQWQATWDAMHAQHTAMGAEDLSARRAAHALANLATATRAAVAAHLATPPWKKGKR